MNDKPEAAKVDPKQIHPVGEWKYTSPLLSCRFDPSGQHAFCTAQDNTIQRWNIANGQATPLAGHDSWVRALAFHPSGSHLISGGYDGNLLWWEVSAEKPEPLRTVAAHDGWVRAVAASADGKLLASCGNDQLVKLWNPDDGTPVDVLEGHANHVYNVAFHPDGKRLVSGDLKGEVREWDLATGEQLRTLDASALWKYDKGFRADIGGVRGIAFSADASLLACGGISEVTNAFAGIGYPKVVTFDYEAGTLKKTHTASKKLRGAVWNVRYLADGTLVAGDGGHEGGHFLFWNAHDEKEFFDFKMPRTCYDFDLHPDGVRLVSTHDDNMLRLWSMAPKA
ncbi:MAG: WD40 repeat domain-containing protein [Planctomycetota bacterium]|nr:MAG: WD40 repeat domain-containing protein [Planctomycetota bacterium]